MLSAHTAMVFFAASVLLALVPGPDNVFVLLHAAVHGARAGLLVVLGLCSGLLFHTAAVALGLAALLAASSAALTALKALGAAYLLWLAWLSWRAPAGLDAGHATPVLGARQTYLRGVLMNISNPKVALFFLAFLPQFVEPAGGPVVLQILQLGAVFMLATLLTFGAIALLAGRFGQLLHSSPRAQVGLNRLASVVFAGLALRLVLAG
ncbi:MAG: LysE family translocator [Betaproteobacteria bacterium]